MGRAWPIISNSWRVWSVSDITIYVFVDRSAGLSPRRRNPVFVLFGPPTTSNGRYNNTKRHMLRKGSICMEDMHSTAEAIIQQLKLSRAITKKLVETCIV